MSLVVFLGCCVLGLAFMIYVLFKWAFGEEYRKHLRKVAYSGNGQTAKSYVVEFSKPRRGPGSQRDAA